MFQYDHKIYLPMDSKTKDKHVLIIVEVLSGYVWAFPCKTLESKELIQTLKPFFHSLARKPEKIFVDNGSNFISKEHHELLDSLNIEIIHSTPGHSRGRGMYFYYIFLTLIFLYKGLVEQKHICIVNPLMKYYQNDKNGEWAKYVPDVVSAYNSTVRRPNSTSPREFLFGLVPSELLPGFVRF